MIWLLVWLHTGWMLLLLRLAWRELIRLRGTDWLDILGQIVAWPIALFVSLKSGAGWRW